MKRKYYSTLFIVLSFVFALFLSISAKSWKNESVPFSILEGGINASLRQPGPLVKMFRIESDFVSFFSLLHQTQVPKPSTPEINFNEHSAVFVSYGQKRTAGYSIEVRDVFKRGTTLTIRAVLITPPEDMFQAQMITHPYVLLLVPREDYGRIQLMDEKGKVRMFKNL